MKSTSQGLKLAKKLAKEFVISEEKAYSYVKRAPLTLYDNIGESKLKSIEPFLKEIDAEYEIETIVNTSSKKRVAPQENKDKVKIPTNIELDTASAQNTGTSESNTLLYILLSLILLLFISSIAVFGFFFSQKKSGVNLETAKAKTTLPVKKVEEKSGSFKKKLKSFLAADYDNEDILKLIFEGKFEQAESVLAEKIRKEGESSDSYKKLGILHFTWAYANGDKSKWENFGTNMDDLWNDPHINKSLNYFEKSLSMNGDDYEVINYLGVIFYEKGWFKRAEKMYKQAIHKNPSYTEAHSNLGILYNALGDLKRAEIKFEQVIRIDKNYNDAYLNLALVSNRLKKYDKAIYYLKIYTEFRPADANYLSAIQLLGKLEKQAGVKND